MGVPLRSASLLSSIRSFFAKPRTSVSHFRITLLSPSLRAFLTRYLVYLSSEKRKTVISGVTSSSSKMIRCSVLWPMKRTHLWNHKFVALSLQHISGGSKYASHDPKVGMVRRLWRPEIRSSPVVSLRPAQIYPRGCGNCWPFPSKLNSDLLYIQKQGVALERPPALSGRGEKRDRQVSWGWACHLHVRESWRSELQIAHWRTADNFALT